MMKLKRPKRKAKIEINLIVTKKDHFPTIKMTTNSISHIKDLRNDKAFEY